MIWILTASDVSQADHPPRVGQIVKHSLSEFAEIEECAQGGNGLGQGVAADGFVVDSLKKEKC